MPSLAPSASATTQPGAGDTVWIGTLVQGHPGTRLHSVYSPVPADTSNPGTPDYWAYCIEHNVSAKTGTTGVAGNVSAFLGTNYYDTDPTIPGKVMWIVANSYPAISLSDFATAAGVPGLTPNDAIEAIQYAIWRYTDLTFDANWNWAGSDSTANAEAAYWYLIGKINQGNTLTPGSASVTASVTAPGGAQQAGTLVGPFTVHTNQPTVSVTVAPGVGVTDAAGTLIDTSAVTDGQQIYLDLRGSTTAGSATVTVTAQGAGGTGMTISVPTTSGGTPTTGNHAQSLVLVAASTATTTGSAAVNWTAAPAPSIGTTLVDKVDDDHTIPAGGGVVVDTIAYSNLTPGTSYTVTGELRKKSDGSATGITGTKTFTPVSANGTVEVEFTVPAGYAGQSLVAFEELTVTGQPAVVAEHKDINDTAQTVSVSPAPSIGTTLVDKADDDHTIPAGGGVVVDTIAYSNLTPGTSYTVTGELRKKSDGSATGITGTKTFTPVSANGTVEVEFTVPAGYAGQSLVAFEELTVTGQPAVVAEHKDINDTAQTVSVQKGAPTVNTQASAATVTVGASLHDVVTITGFVPGGSATGTAVLYGPLSAVNDTVCTEGNVAGTVTFTPANGTITTPTVTVTQPGLYTWQVTVSADDRNDKATHACGLAAETTTVQQSGTGSGGESKVSLTTETSHDQVKPGAQVFDKVTITGFVPGYGATGSATLYGPFASRDKIACTPANAVGTVNFTPGNGVVHTPTVQVNQTGYYTWVASTTADSHNTAASHACGLVSETTLVHKPAYATPTVSTGFANDGWKPAGRRTVDRIRIPSLGVNARTSLVGIKRGTMQVPGNVARTGQLSQSAAADDLIGTTVIAGHVSDRHDRPGAFWKLTKIRKGKVVTLWQGGKKLRYRVTSIQRFSRTSKLPDRFFSTTGEHQLVLISCAGKVTTSSGGFHYRQNVVVTAVPLG
ncbi:VaFE repeat-containing surface-anchored protein [Nocardioides sp. SLBN-35]|uniref:VaFE repeat-containing surface-anchored protein n=1 Tax=Nocardioides sp. SLBN-35 TaxID=2768445 RepID=UPI00116AEC83|nr:VaFE repeat-containing surface-anchored protein [Nocardioides sp. SLBN-35]TQK73287.1 TQXA domain-containing protein [Nocardioides sp. SLBN-35]